MKFFFKKLLPNRERLGKSKAVRYVLDRVGNAYIWQVNRRSIAGGVAVGLFFGSLPIPIQIPCSLLVAGFLRYNVSIAAFATLYSNPLTMPVLFYMNYRVGKWLFSGSTQSILQEDYFSVDNLMHMGGKILVPLFSGSIVVGIVLAFLSYFLIYFLWYWQLLYKLKGRKKWFEKLRVRYLKRCGKHVDK